MNKIQKFKLKSFSKASGKLIPISFDKKFPIKVKRVFFLYGKKNKIRGDHAHKKCSQLFICLLGKVGLTIKTLNATKKININHLSKDALLIPPKYWCSVKFLKKNSILMVVCDQYYKFSDYIETFKDYKKYLRKK